MRIDLNQQWENQRMGLTIPQMITINLPYIYRYVFISVILTIGEPDLLDKIIELIDALAKLISKI